MALTADEIARLNGMCPAAETAALGTEINNAVSGVLDVDSVGDTEIDFGTGAGQVSGADVPLADAATYFTTDTVEAALAQIMAERAQVGDGVAGADYTGMTAITQTGAAATVQAVIEALVDVIVSTADGVAGADYTGMTAITETGAAADVQSVIEALVAVITSTSNGVAGADYTGMTAISETGAAADVQSVIEALVTALTAVTDSASGGDLVGMTVLSETGANATVQSVIEALVAVLVSVANGTAGADFVGMTAITETGAAATVQAVVEALVDVLTSTSDGVAGADYVGATAISGWSGGDVQTILESAKVVVDNVTARVNDDLRMPLVLGGTLGSDVGLGGTLVGLPAATDPGTATILPAVFGWDNGEAADSQAVDYTAEAASAGADDVLVFPAVATIEDAFHISAVEKFHAVLVDIGVQADMAVTTVWEYSDNAGDATSFTAIPAATMADATTAMQVAGTSTYLITFVPPTDWAAIIPSGETDDVVLKDVARYTIRCRISAFTSTTTEPVVTQVWTYHLSTMAGIPAPVTGSVASIMFNFNTASGSTGDSYFLLGNVTQGTYQSYNKTKATVFEIVAGVLAVTEGDELVLMQVAEDGSTEFADGSGTLLITPTAVS